MDEAILIEIAERFRKLEDVYECADLFLASLEEDYKKALKKADSDYETHKDYGRFCRAANQPEADLNNLIEVRDSIEKAFDASRDDLVTLHAAIRGKR